MIAKVIKPKLTNRDKAANNAYKEQKSANATACLAITLNLKETPQQVVTDCITAKSMWDTLCTQYKGKGHNLKQQLIKKLTRHTCESSKNVTNYIIEFKAILAKLAALDCSTLDDQYQILFIAGLADHFL